MSAVLVISHPVEDHAPNPTFILAQGDTTLPDRSIIGILRDHEYKEVARSKGTTYPPTWHIPFTKVRPGVRYRLEVIDAQTGEKLAHSGPFDVLGVDPPGCFYPQPNNTVGVNVTPYGATNSQPVTSKMERNGALLQNGTATPGLPSTMWGQQYTNLPVGPNNDVTFTATDGTGNTVVASLKIQ